MEAQRIVVIGASSGGVETLRELVRGLAAGFPAPICIVLHTSPDSPGLLAKILADASVLSTVTAADGMTLDAGHIYVAPPDCHLLLVEPGTMRLGRGPKENRFRPAIDPLFRSAAQAYGSGAVGVILSGSLDDGSAGLRALKQLGGIAIVQDPHDALFSSMPANALRHVAADHVVPLRELARVLAASVATQAPRGRSAAPSQPGIEVAIAQEDSAVDRDVKRIADPSVFTCPDCHGVLLELKEQGILRFRCHTGHAYSAESLLVAVNEGIENALWSAVQAVKEGRLLLERMTYQNDTAPTDVKTRLRTQLSLVTDQVELLREMVGRRVALVSTEE